MGLQVKDMLSIADLSNIRAFFYATKAIYGPDSQRLNSLPTKNSKCILRTISLLLFNLNFIHFSTHVGKSAKCH